MSWFTSRDVHENAVWHSLPTTMTCPLCGRESTARGFKQHLNCCCPKHGLTIEDYRREHWNVLFQPFHCLVANTYSLMDFQQDAFGWQWAMLPGGTFFLEPKTWHSLPKSVHWGYQEIRPQTNRAALYS